MGAANCLDPVFLEDIGATVAIEQNVIDNMGCQRSGTDGSHGLAVHTFSGAATRIIIRDNWFMQGGTNFAIEVTQNGTGLVIESCLIDGNHVTLGAVANGGISLGGSNRCSITNNYVNLNRFTPSIAGFEIVNSLNAVFTGNHVWGGGPNSFALSCDTSSGTRGSANDLGGYVVIANSGTFKGVTDLSWNTFTENLVTIPPGSTNPHAILLQCNVTLCSARNNVVSLNTLRGLDIPNSVGIYLQDDFGVIDGTQVFKNLISGFPVKFDQASNVTNTDQ